MAVKVKLPGGALMGAQICKIPVLELKVWVCCPVTDDVYVRINGGVPVSVTDISWQLPPQTSIMPEKATVGDGKFWMFVVADPVQPETSVTVN